MLVMALLVAAVATACGETPGPSDLQAGGTWGGVGIQLEVLPGGGARIDYGCDSGTIDGRLPGSGPFELAGTHTFGSGGPRQPDEPPRTAHLARYDGMIAGNTMTLMVSLPTLSRRIGEFSLELNRRATLERCG